MLPLALVLLAGLFLRLFGVYWDMGAHLHPDERMLILVADRIHFFSNLDPNFFNYGSLPVYILSGVNQISQFLTHSTESGYDSMLLPGRYLSILADLIVIVLIYKISSLIFRHSKTPIIASAVYAIMFFPIQNTHFFIVDPFLNVFLLLATYRSLLYINKPGSRTALYTALALAAAAACKVTAIVFYPVLVAAIVYGVRHNRKKIITNLFFFHFALLISHMVFMPFAYLHYPQFISDVLNQTRMNNDAYVFPYTLQYVGSLPYWYHIKNIVLWGVGPFLSLAASAGFLIGIRHIILVKKKHHTSHNSVLILFLTIGYVLYFLLLGRSAVKFMRYMLPLYPLIAISAGYFFSTILSTKLKALGGLIAACALIYTLMFVTIYTHTHTRFRATQWILEQVPRGSAIAVEHWDDMIPVYGSSYYDMKTLPLYEQPDNDSKWIGIKETLQQSDYMIIASNRLSTPIRNLRDCNKYKVCFPVASHYYDSLFSGTSNYKLVARFDSFPELKAGPFKFTIPDTSADESFTVYDHPSILIFKKS